MIRRKGKRRKTLDTWHKTKDDILLTPFLPDGYRDPPGEMILPLKTPALKGDIWQVRLIKAEFTGPFPPGGRLGKGVKIGEGGINNKE